MSITCSECGVLFEADDVCYRVKVDGRYAYYHLLCGSGLNVHVANGGVVVIAKASWFQRQIGTWSTDTDTSPRRGAYMRGRQSWTAEELRLIEDNLTVSNAELAKLTGHPEKSVASKKSHYRTIQAGIGRVENG